MKKTILTLAVLCCTGLGAAAPSVDTTKVRAVDTIERPTPMINWDIPPTPPPTLDSIIYSKDSTCETRIYRTAHGVEEIQILHGNVVRKTHPQEMKIEGVEVKVKY